jgi:hypothetical protein
MRRLTAILMAALLCFAVTACGGDDSDKADTKDTSSRDTSSSDEGSGGAGLTDDELEAKLLSASDVGSGWTADTSDDSDDESDDDSDESDPECIKQLDEIEETDSSGSAEITFTAPDDITELSESLDAYAPDDVDAAAEEFDKGFDALDDCGEFEMDIEGSTANGSIERVADAKSYGDKSGVWVMTLEVEGVQLTSAFVVILQDGIGVSLNYTELGPDAVEHVTPFIDKALAKL